MIEYPTWQLDSKIACRTIDDETIVIGINDGQVHLLNDTATSLWCSLQSGPKNERELTEVLTSTYDIDEATAIGDLHDFIAKLTEKHLLKVVPATRKDLP